MLGPNRFRFLNVQGVVNSAADWNRRESKKIWLYNLHYFDDLNAEGAPSRRDWHASLVSRWILENPPGHGNGWEPYPTSLRIVNWIKWALSGNELPPVAVHSLAVQVRYLHRRLEFHLLGNHLFANAKALIFAGLYFLGDEAAIWLNKGVRTLVVEVPEQVLKDGGHFERSPMYHALIQEDLLDLVNLYRTFGREAPADWLAAGERMHAWLHALTHPDGEIALFNDSAFALNPTWAGLNAYRNRLGLATIHEGPRRLTHFPESGYIRGELVDWHPPAGCCGFDPRDQRQCGRSGQSAPGFGSAQAARGDDLRASGRRHYPRFRACTTPRRPFRSTVSPGRCIRARGADGMPGSCTVGGTWQRRRFSSTA